VSDRKLRLGVAGLGRAFTLMLPTFARDARLQLVAAADPQPNARARFATDFAAKVYASVEELCGDPAVEIVYLATPHQFHAQHAIAAASKKKHVLVEKPMALTIEDCRTMINAARSAGVHLIVGHSHSFDLPIKRAREIIASGTVGEARMISALNFTDFLYRPRRPEELDTERGGGVVFSQAAHQVDIVRLLGGGLIKSVRAATGAWDSSRPTEGAYSALLTFTNGAFASLVYSGYGRFDSDEFCDWIGELGAPKALGRYGAARKLLQQVSSPEEEAALKSAKTYGGKDYVHGAGNQPISHEHFGLILVSCERADVRPTPQGVIIYEDMAQRFESLPPPTMVPRAEVIDELYDAIVLNRPPVHSGEWGLATLEVCLALLTSARLQKEVELKHQVGLPG
jgi:phthalate 4,5-cis-dihydrodiol dehydrogenase